MISTLLHAQKLKTWQSNPWVQTLSGISPWHLKKRSVHWKSGPEVLSSGRNAEPPLQDEILHLPVPHVEWRGAGRRQTHRDDGTGLTFGRSSIVIVVEDVVGVLGVNFIVPMLDEFIL